MSRRPPRPREYIDELPRYVAGSEAFQRDGAPGHKLSSNESPYPVPQGMVAAMADVAQRANRYPPNGEELVRRIAARHSVPQEMVAVSGGSLEMLRDLLTAYAGYDSDLMFGWRSYEAYPILVQALGARSAPAPLRDHVIDLTALSAAISPKTRVGLLANPNNPTGTVIDADALTRFVSAVPEQCLLVLDEAYSEYGESELGA